MLLTISYGTFLLTTYWEVAVVNRLRSLCQLVAKSILTGCGGYGLLGVLFKTAAKLFQAVKPE